MAKAPKNMDEYLAALSEGSRAPLEKLRKTIRSTAPKAGPLVSFGAAKNHCSFYVMPPRAS